mgnify:CR=1 FL=1
MNRKLACRVLFLFVPGFVASAISAAEEVVIPRGDAGWKYLDQTAEPGENWSAASFDDAEWSEGQALLGYGDDDVRTKLSYGNNVVNKRRVAFFRKLFRIRNRARFKRYVGRVCCDDGAVVYVNRCEVFRRNMPAGRVTSSTLAVRAVGPDSRNERQYVTFLVEDNVVRDGHNVVAVSVHQATPTSSDLALDLELVGLETEEEVRKVEESVKQSQPDGQSGAVNSLPGPIVRFSTSAQ